MVCSFFTHWDFCDQVMIEFYFPCHFYSSTLYSLYLFLDSFLPPTLFFLSVPLRSSIQFPHLSISLLLTLKAGEKLKVLLLFVHPFTFRLWASSETMTFWGNTTESLCRICLSSLQLFKSFEQRMLYLKSLLYLWSFMYKNMIAMFFWGLLNAGSTICLPTFAGSENVKSSSSNKEIMIFSETLASDESVFQSVSSFFWWMPNIITRWGAQAKVQLEALHRNGCHLSLPYWLAIEKLHWVGWEKAIFGAFNVISSMSHKSPGESAKWG